MSISNVVNRAEMEKMAETIEIVVRIKNVYGKEMIYPVCNTAKALALLAGHMTLTTEDLRIIKMLGYSFKVETPSLAVGD